MIHGTNLTVSRLYRWYTVRTGLYHDYTGGTQYELDCIVPIPCGTQYKPDYHDYTGGTQYELDCIVPIPCDTQYKYDCITTIQVVHSTNWTVSCLYHVVHSTNRTVSLLYRWYTVQTRVHRDYTGGT